MRTLYPDIEPYDTGRLAVDARHTLYYEQCGNPQGKPVVLLHGGPGAGCSAKMRGFHDPAKYRIVLFDQRGSGRSVPHADLVDNTTWDLVDDIERLREALGVERWQVFGGSWGSTLSLCYAVTYPERVTELVLRGIFLFDQYELDWLYKEGGASSLYPDKWDDFAGFIPEAERGDLLTAYRKRLTSDDQDIQLAAAKTFAVWEGNVVTLLPDPAVIDDFAEPHKAVAIARIENHYMIHKGWLEDGQLLSAAAEKLRGIPGIIVQGRHDCCTPPRAAWALKKAWPEVDLQIVPDGGHLYSEPGVLDGLVRATDKFAGL